MLRKAFSPNLALLVRLSTSSWYPLSKELNKLNLSSGEAFLKSVRSIICSFSTNDKEKKKKQSMKKQSAAVLLPLFQF